jgi:transposase
MLNAELIKTFQDAARELPKEKRRIFQSRITRLYLGGSARKAESYFGWSRETVKLGQMEERTGITCLGNYSARGRKRMEKKFPELEKDIREIVDRESQTDPKFQTEKKFCKISAAAVCTMLEEEKGYDQGSFSQQTMNTMLNRFGYHLKKL